MHTHPFMHQVIQNECDVASGQSGSPVWEERNGSPYIRGIVSYGTCTCQNSNCTVCGLPYKTFFQQLTTTRFNDATRLRNQS